MGPAHRLAPRAARSGALSPAPPRRLARLLGAWLLALALPAWPAVFGPVIEPLADFPSERITVESGGRSHAFTVWIAATPARHEQGLMFQKSLPPARGMLFLFERPEVQNFWMKNTLIPLDLAFIAPNGQIIRIAERATPLSEATITSFGLVTGVLELAGGSCARLGIRAGDRVRHPAFNAP